MNTAKLRAKRVIVPVAVVAALGIGGGVWASAASADVGGSERDKVSAAAVQAVGAGSTVLDVESSDDAGEAYEAEVRKADGTEVDVTLDKDFKVLAQQADTDTDTDAPERALTDAERTSAEQAALAAVGSGTVAGVEAGDEGDTAAYEVEVRDGSGQEWDVDLDAAYKVLSKTQD